MKKQRDIRKIAFIAALCVLAIGAGCQSFRTSHSTIDQEQDQKVGDAVGEAGLGLYWVLQFVSWF